MRIRNITFVAFIMTLVLGVASSAFAQRDTGNNKKMVKVKPVVKYRDWTVFKHPVGNDVMCFTASSPKDMIPKEVKRSEVTFYVTRWKSNPANAQVSILIGYPFKEGSKLNIRIRSQEFKLFVKGDKAWVRDDGDEKLLLAAMRRGSKMKITGVSAQGIMTTDQYSLSGISKALNKIKRLCR